jgi:hypothetical protein
VRIYDNDKLIEGTGNILVAVEAHLHDGVKVATFDELGATGSETYAATIDWGDGTAPTAGTVAALTPFS